MYNITKNPELVALAQQVHDEYKENKGSIVKLCTNKGISTNTYYRIKRAGKLKESIADTNG